MECLPTENNGTDDIFVGIDISLTGNAVVLINKDGKIIHKLLVSTIKDLYINPEQRILDIFDQVKFISGIVNLRTIYIEGLSYMSVSPTLFERCGLLYMITTFLFRCNIFYKIVPPTSLKKWTTTDGFADKVLMMRVAKCKWGIEFTDDNICDAYCLAMLAREEYYNNTYRLEKAPKPKRKKRKKKNV